MSVRDLLLAFIGFQVTLTAAALIVLARLHGRLTRLEEWVRLTEKQLNGKERR